MLTISTFPNLCWFTCKNLVKKSLFFVTPPIISIPLLWTNYLCRSLACRAICWSFWETFRCCKIIQNNPNLGNQPIASPLVRSRGINLSGSPMTRGFGCAKIFWFIFSLKSRTTWLNCQISLWEVIFNLKTDLITSQIGFFYFCSTRKKIELNVIG